MSRKPLTFTVSTPIRVEELLAAICGSQSATEVSNHKLPELNEQLSQLKHKVWHGKRVKITITEHQPSEQDYLNAAIREGLLSETPDAEYPYAWNSKFTKEMVSVFVERVCFRLGYAQPWRWAKKLFGLNNLSQLNYNLKDMPRYKDIVGRVTNLLDNA